jgi:F-type H+-transporting ATPase subunit epsilon
MAEVATLRVRVVTSEESVFEGEASSVVAPSWDGMVGILPSHAPMIALLGMGKLSVDRASGGAEEYYVVGGVLKVDKNQVTILTEEYSGIDLAPVGNPLV